MLRPSGPDALPVANVFKTDSTSGGDRTILSRYDVKGKRGISGRKELFSGRIVWSQKKLFRILTLSSSSVYTIPLWSRGGTEDLELGEIKFLRIDHQFLEERESDFSLFEILSL